MADQAGVKPSSGRRVKKVRNPSNLDDIPTVQYMVITNHTSATLYVSVELVNSEDNIEYSRLDQSVPTGQSKTFDLGAVLGATDPSALDLWPMFASQLGSSSSNWAEVGCIFYAANGLTANFVVTDGPPQPTVAYPTVS